MYTCSNNANSESNPNNSEDANNTGDSDETKQSKQIFNSCGFIITNYSYVLGYKKDYNDWPIYAHKKTKEAETNTEPVAVGGNNVTSDQGHTNQSDQGHTNQNHKGSTDTTTEHDNPTLEHSSNNVDGSSCTPNEPTRNDHHESEHEKDTVGSRNDDTTTADTGTETGCCCSCYCCSCCGCIRYYFICTFFLVAKYCAQAATVPLILLQMFDTYAFLCFASNEAFCTPTSEYRIHAFQTMITIGFYCSLALSLLASTILEWKPWPKKFTDQRSCPCV